METTFVNVGFSQYVAVPTAEFAHIEYALWTIVVVVLIFMVAGLWLSRRKSAAGVSLAACSPC